MPITFSLIANLFFFGFTLWLGAYLLARGPQKLTVRLTGLGIVFFAVVLALETIAGKQPNALLLLPVLFWIGVVLDLIPIEGLKQGFADGRPIQQHWLESTLSQ